MASCSSKDKPYFNTGDSFNLPIELFDIETQQPVAILPDMGFYCNIADVSGSSIASPTVLPHPDQVNFKGYLTIAVPSEVTATWKVGKAKFDIKVTVQGVVRHTKKFYFDIEESITP